MTALIERLRGKAAQAARSGQPVSSFEFDWVMALIFVWIMAGVVMDTLAHGVLGSTIESFFNTMHDVIYSGLLAAGVVIVGASFRNYRQGYPLLRCVPRGYALSLLGLALAGAAGGADFLWHSLLGFEAGIEPLLSPPHLVIVSGMLLVASGPLRAAWWRPRSQMRGLAWLPMLVSVSMMYSGFSWMTQWANPLQLPLAGPGHRLATDFDGIALGMASILLYTAFVMGLLLSLLRRWLLPPGSLTLIFALNALVVNTIHPHLLHLPVAHALAGVAGDGLLILLKPSLTRTTALRLFAAALPASQYALYFAALSIMEGIWWSVHLWAGAIFLAGLVGWLVALLVVPPLLPEDPA